MLLGGGWAENSAPKDAHLLLPISMAPGVLVCRPHDSKELLGYPSGLASPQAGDSGEAGRRGGSRMRKVSTSLAGCDDGRAVRKGHEPRGAGGSGPRLLPGTLGNFPGCL